MYDHKLLSSYLVRPANMSRYWRPWFSPNRGGLKKVPPHVTSRLLVAVGIWGALAWSVNYLYTPHYLPSQASLELAQATSNSKSPANLNPVTPVTPVMPTPKATIPTPPAPAPAELAAFGTFRNNYTAGQCTWYVASRRHIPSGWGNADEWYYHAEWDGWRVGTTPAIGAVAWTAAGAYGHVAVVLSTSADLRQVYIGEMNYYGPYIPDKRWVASSSFRYIY